MAHPTAVAKVNFSNEGLGYGIVQEWTALSTNMIESVFCMIYLRWQRCQLGGDDNSPSSARATHHTVNQSKWPPDDQ